MDNVRLADAPSWLERGTGANDIPRVINLYGLYSFQPWQNEIHPGILQISGPLAPQTLGTKSGQNDGEHLRESFMNRSKIQMVQKKHGEHKSQQEIFKRSLFGSNPSMHGCRFLACLQTCTTWLWRPGTGIPSCYAVMDVLWPSGMMETRTPRSSTNWWQEVQVCATFMGPIGYLRISKSLQLYRNLWLYWMSLERRIATFAQGCLSDGG